MRCPSLFMAAVAAGLVLSACTGGPAHRAVPPAKPVTAPTAMPSTGPAGSPGHPVVFGCAEESFTGSGVPQQPQPGDLGIGPLIIPGGQRLATARPADYGEHGSYKIPVVVPMGATVTVTIEPPARGHVVISNPYAPAGVTAATYRPCAHVAGFYAQSFAFTGGQIRGCVPLEVKAGGQPRIRRVTLSLFAGSCSG